MVARWVGQPVAHGFGAVRLRTARVRSSQRYYVLANDLTLLDHVHAEVGSYVAVLVEVETARRAFVIDLLLLRQQLLAFGEGKYLRARRIGDVANLAIYLRDRRTGTRRLHGERQRYHHVVRHRRIDIGRDRLAHRFLILGVQALVRSGPLVGDCVDSDHAFDDFVAERFDQIGVGGPARHDPFDVLACLIPLAQKNRRIGKIGTGDDDVGLGAQYLLQFRAITGPVRLVDDARHDFAMRFLPYLLESFCVADARGIVERHCRRTLEAALFGRGPERGADLIVGRLESPDQILGVER